MTRAAPILLCAWLAGCEGGAVGPPTLETVDGGPSVLVSAAEGQQAYGGVARVGIGSTCSGVLLAPRDRAAGAPAYVLTNGHCARAFGSDEVLLDRPGSGSVTFQYFHDATARPSYAVRSIRFSTMKGTDLAILELDARLDDLAARGIHGVEIEDDRPEVDAPVLVAGAPVSPAGGESYLRLASCRLENQVDVLLERHWHWFDFWRHGCRDIRPGSSGSPVLSRRDGRLLGVVNTTTFDSEGVTDCWLGRPCELDGPRARSLDETSYTAPVAGLDECFDGSGVLDRARSRCPLDDGRQLALRPAWLAARNPDRTNATARWDIVVAGDAFPSFRYKLGPAGSVDCRDARGYGDARRVTAGSRIDDPLPAEEGHFAACVVGVPDTGSIRDGQGLDHASMVTLQIDKTPPRATPRFEVQDSGSAWHVFSVFAPPEITVYVYKSGPAADTDCAAPAGYRPFVTSPTTIAKSGGPVRFCAIGKDLADNPTPPFDLVLR